MLKTPPSESATQKEITRFLRGESTHDELSRGIGMSQTETASLLMAAARAQGLIANTATVSLTPPSSGTAVGANDYVVVVVDELRIRRLFSNSEQDKSAQPLLGSRFQQEGAFTLDVNGHPYSISWQRGCANAGPFKCRSWSEYVNTSRTVLFAGQPKGFLQLNFGVQESEASEARLIERIQRRLGIAASAAGLVPGLGTIVSAGLSLGAAIAELVKSNLDDDRELSYLGFIGDVGETPIPLEFGQYHLSRITTGETDNDIDVKFSVLPLVPPDAAQKKLTIVLESVDLSNLANLLPDDRILLEATITAPPVGGIDTEPTINAFSFEHPFLSKKEISSELIPFDSVVELKNQLLFDGAWTPVISFNLGVTGIPRELHAEEWLQVLSKTGEVIGLVVDASAQPVVEQGFQIAQNAAGFLAKYLPDIRFAASKSGLFVKKDAHTSPPDCLIEIDADDTGTWQAPIDVTLPVNGYGAVTYRLRAKVTDIPVANTRLPANLFNEQTTNVNSETWVWLGGAGTVEAYGVWDGATITLQQSTDNVNWNDVDLLSTNGISTFEYLAPETLLRAKLQSASGKTSITCVLNRPSRDQLLAEIRSTM